MALHLRLAENAVFLNGLSEPCQQVLLRLAVSKLDKHEDTLASDGPAPMTYLSGPRG